MPHSLELPEGLEPAQSARPIAGLSNDPASLLRAVEAAVLGGLAAVDTSGQQVYVSSGFCNMVGWDERELLNTTAPFRYWPPEEVEVIQAAFEATLAGRAPPDGFELRFCRRNGERFHVLVNIKPISDDVGAALGWLASVTDISQRRANERRLTFEHTVPKILAESTSLADATPRLIQTICEGLGWAVGALWRVDPNTQLLQNECIWFRPDLIDTEFVQVTANMAFPSGVGLPGRVWASGQPSWVMDVTTDGNFPRAQAAVAASLFTGMAFPIWTDHEVTGVLECFGQKMLIPDRALLAVLSNIGQQIGNFVGRKQAEAALQTTQAQHSAALATVGEAIIVIDATSTILQVNEEVVRTWGYPACELIGSPLVRLMPEAYRKRHMAGMQRYLATSEAHVLGQRLELEGLRQDGTVFPLELRIAETRLGDQLLFTAAVRDITDRKRIEAALHESRDQLRTILEGVSEGVTVQDSTGRLVYANDVAAKVLGFASAEALMSATTAERLSRFEIVEQIGGPLPWQHLPGQRALHGEPSAWTVIRLRIKATGEEHWARIRAQVIRDAGGRVQLEVTIFDDITDLKRTELEQRLLAEAGRLLAAPLDHDARLIEVARLVVPRLAHWCAIHVVEPDETIRLVTVAHTDPSRMLEAERQASPLNLGTNRTVAQVARTGQSLFMAEITDAMLAANAATPEDLSRLRASQLRSAMVVPLLARDRTLGTLTFLLAETDRRYNRHDLALAEELARLAAVAAHNAQLYEEAQALNADLEVRVSQRTEQLQRAQAEAQALSQRLLAAREDERTSIAREIHDELGQQLTGLKMDLMRLNKGLPHDEPATLQDKTRQMAAMLDHTIQTVRRIATDLRPAILDDFGLLAAIEWQVQEIQRRTGIIGRFDSKIEVIDLERDTATAVFRACQEALTNIVRHAQATAVEVAIEKATGGFMVIVRDNGRGISEHELLGSQSLGLLGMRERVQLIGGTLRIQGISGSGTTVTILVPWSSP